MDQRTSRADCYGHFVLHLIYRLRQRRGEVTRSVEVDPFQSLPEPHLRLDEFGSQTAEIEDQASGAALLGVAVVRPRREVRDHRRWSFVGPIGDSDPAEGRVRVGHRSADA